jgi:parvulin-like peptidyl-prolyl cis-trans isomerase-like protein/SurA-like protein
MPEAAASRRPLVWLAAGAAAGVALAAWGLLGTDARGAALPEGAVASVNGTLLYTEDYQRLVEGVESDTREPASPELRRRVLDRMIDEELLVQRGVELGLVESDRRIRADITQAMIQSIVVETEDEKPAEGELRRFYEEQAGFFTQPGRVRAAQVFFRVRSPGDEAALMEKATEAQQRLLAGAPLEQVRGELGDEEISPIPDALLPPAKLREYVGPTALRAVMELAPGATSAPVRSGMGVHVFQLIEREEPRVPPFEEVAAHVQAEWVRRAGDRALRGYLDELRHDAQVVAAEALP